MTPTDHNPGPPHQDQRIWPQGHPGPPAHTPPLTHRLAAPFRALHNALANLATNPGTVTTTDGVTYTPLTRTTLAQAIKATGHLDYAVTFPDSLNGPRKRINIRATHDRIFHDLPPISDHHARAFHTLRHAALAAVRPGDRVLLLGAGTGALTAALADHVGPSGAVTACEADALSVAFARARYPVPNAAHERLTPSTLAAEPPAAAETIILTHLAPARLIPGDPTELAARLAKPGRILLSGPHTALADAFRTIPGLTLDHQPRNRTNEPPDSAFVVVRKTPNA